MKLVQLIFITTLAVACSCKGKTAAVSNSNSVEEENLIRGKITTAFSSEGCPLLIEFTEEGNKTYLDPIELPEEYQKDGIEILFSFVPSRAPQTTCFKGRPAVIETIKPAK